MNRTRDSSFTQSYFQTPLLNVKASGYLGNSYSA